MSDARNTAAIEPPQRAAVGTDTDGVHDSRAADAQRAYIAETLDWCAELFGTSRARFIRPLASGRWYVYTRQRDTLTTHTADFAEGAMAYAVGLGRQPLVVTRPRVSNPDGSNLRPIALTSYLGIPIVVQDRLVGVIECAGDVRPDVDVALFSAMPRLTQVGMRLLFDPSLQARPAASPESSLALTSEVWSATEITLTAEEMTFLAAVDADATVATVAVAVGIDLQDAVALAASLAQRGLITISAAGTGNAPDRTMTA